MWAISWSVVVLAVTGLPYLYGAVASTPNSQFSGFVIGLEDGNSYLAKMQQGRSGYWLFRLVYTPEPHQGEPFFIFYILLGKVAGLTGLSNLALFHLSRIVTVPFGLLAFYYFAAYFTQQVKIRQLAFIIFGLSAGLGWLWLIGGGASKLGRMPVDLWVPDASYFLSALTFPHLPLAQGLLFLFSVTGLEFIQSGQKWTGVMAALYGVAVSLIHPHTLPVMGLLLGLYILWQHFSQKRQLIKGGLRLVVTIVPSLPYLLYVLIVFARNPAFVAWREQSLTYSPAPAHYLLGFGLPLLFAIVGVVITGRRPDAKIRFLRIWFLSVPVLVYLPLALQRRFLDGYQGPLAVLAAMGLWWMAQLIAGKRAQMAAIGGFLFLMTLTNLLLVTGAIVTIAQRFETVFVPIAQVKAAQWLAAGKPKAVVLAAYDTGNYLPTIADVRTFVGHGPETARSDEKRQLAAQFFAVATSDIWRQQLLAQYNIQYLYYGSNERNLGEFFPADASYLQLVYDNRQVQIYRVINNE